MIQTNFEFAWPFAIDRDKFQLEGENNYGYEETYNKVLFGLYGVAM